jgi:hypothetical protein
MEATAETQGVAWASAPEDETSEEFTARIVATIEAQRVVYALRD